MVYNKRKFNSVQQPGFHKLLCDHCHWFNFYHLIKVSPLINKCIIFAIHKTIYSLTLCYSWKNCVHSLLPNLMDNPNYVRGDFYSVSSQRPRLSPPSVSLTLSLSQSPRVPCRNPGPAVPAGHQLPVTIRRVRCGAASDSQVLHPQTKWRQECTFKHLNYSLHIFRKQWIVEECLHHRLTSSSYIMDFLKSLCL